MKVLYVASDRPGAGKTVTAMALVLALRNMGMQAGYFKPFCVDPHSDADVDFAKAMGGKVIEPVALRVSEISHPTPAVVVEQALAAMAETEDCDVLVVEGASLSVGDHDLSDISHHVARGLNAKTLGVLDYEAGGYAKELERMGEAFGEDLLGVFVNRAIRHRDARG